MENAGAIPELSPNVISALHKKFSREQRDEVAMLLAEFYWKLRPEIDERIHLGILHAANDLEHLKHLVKLAKQDWRDLIMAAEYELKDGKLRRTEWSLEMEREREARHNAGKS